MQIELGFTASLQPRNLTMANSLPKMFCQILCQQWQSKYTIAALEKSTPISTLRDEFTQCPTSDRPDCKIAMSNYWSNFEIKASLVCTGDERQRPLGVAVRAHSVRLPAIGNLPKSSLLPKFQLSSASP